MQNASNAPTSNIPMSNAPNVLDSIANVESVGNVPNASPSSTAAQFTNVTSFMSVSFSANHANVPDVATPAMKTALPAQTGFKGCS
eukprot:4016796-Ditylum_brightwellii.AAC.1